MFQILTHSSLHTKIKTPKLNPTHTHTHTHTQTHITCQTPMTAFAMRIRRMTMGSTKAVVVSSPSSNRANTWGTHSQVMTPSLPSLHKKSYNLLGTILSVETVEQKCWETSTFLRRMWWCYLQDFEEEKVKIRVWTLTSVTTSFCTGQREQAW